MDFCARILLSCFIEVYSPPVEFDYEPKTPYSITYIDSYELKRKCWGFSAWECVSIGSSSIYIDKELKGLPEGEIMKRHAWAHINGWRH